MELLLNWIIESLFGQPDDVIPRTRLGWTRVGLLAGLIAQTVYLIHVCLVSSVPTFLWFSIVANAVAFLVVRRALRWRYPI